MVDEITPNLKLHYLFSHQSQKEVFINKNFKLIDNAFSGSGTNNVAVNTGFRIYVVVSDAGHVISNFGSVTVSAYSKTKGLYSVEITGGAAFDRSKGLFISAYVNDKISLPYMTNVIFSPSKIDVYIFHSRDGKLEPMNAMFSLMCG
ncbi:hypothetical protein [Candidatus Xenohaliotis californiensis]